MRECDILIIGTGYFAEIMVSDLAATAPAPMTVVIAGRNAARLQWLCTASNARAAIFGRPVRFVTDTFDLSSVDSTAQCLQRWSASVVVQSASLQSPWSVDRPDSPWSRLVGAAGFGITLAFQSMLPVRTASALKSLGSTARFVNTCYPDGVNQVLRASRLPITCGVGNIAIFSSVIAGTLAPADRAGVRVLAHHQHLVQWRKPGAERDGVPPRVWTGETEMTGVQDRFRDIQLPFRDLNVISGGSAAPVLVALAGHRDYRGHVPGPNGLPGGYPVRVSSGAVALDLPAAVSTDEAIAWNRQFEDADGASVTAQGRVVYSERAREALRQVSPDIAAGFEVGELESAHAALQALRARLGG
ncbi:MAG: hypothetical protein ABIP61_13595 [Burkholderiaceae bacterium]